MFNLSSPQDQMSNFIVNNALVVKHKIYVRMKNKATMLLQKNKYKFYNPFT